MKKTVSLFFLNFFAIYALLHLFAAFILSKFFTFYPWIFGSLFLVGYFLTPLGYFIGSRYPRSSFSFLTWAGYIWMGVFFITLWTSVVFVIVQLFLPETLLLHSIFLSVIGVLSSYSLFRGLQSPKVHQEFIKGPGSLKGLRMVQITDLHVGLLHQNEKWLQKIVDRINELNAEFELLTGDLVEGRVELLKPMLRPLMQLRARLGRIYVSGNHELIHGGIIWEGELESQGWTVLHNQCQIFSYERHKILIGGVPDQMIGRFNIMLESNPDKALFSIEDPEYKILLAHEPSSVFDLKTEKPDIILSGHTHGGQIFPFGLIVRMVQPVLSGWKTILGIPVFAHEGTGLWGPPMRLGTRNRIVLFEFI